MLPYHTAADNRFDKQVEKTKTTGIFIVQIHRGGAACRLRETGSGSTVIMLPKPKPQPNTFVTILFCRITAPAEHIMSSTLLIKIV